MQLKTCLNCNQSFLHLIPLTLEVKRKEIEQEIVLNFSDSSLVTRGCCIAEYVLCSSPETELYLYMISNSTAHQYREVDVFFYVNMWFENTLFHYNLIYSS